ncbi:MAG TPA: protein-L-isoaspartate(D-aspartate) O-methyltransferase [Microthrixaceae bacterium]|nr:protein-L-isoaspartate(D-aspartate) O-methyltransferase [Microthrixaceae bacterium]
MTDWAARRRKMVAMHRRRGEVRDERVLAAMADVPREEFVPEAVRDRSYDECALPIGDGQTISQPYVVTLMTAALELEPTDRVLEVGTGSGYQSAVLARLAARVVSVERLAELAAEAEARFTRLGIEGIEVRVADGSLGWPDEAPYDAIVVTAGGPMIPPALLGQLAPGGRLVMPVGPSEAQDLVRIDVAADGSSRRRDLGAVAFVPLIGDQGWHEP